MKLHVAILGVCGVLAACRTTAPAEDTSNVQGGAALEAVSRYMSASTDEEVAKALTERLNELNLYTSEGEVATVGNCPIAADDPCSMVNIFIEFETPGSGSVGHTAVSVSRVIPGQDLANRNDSFFDFGPGKDVIEGKKVKVGDPGIFSLPPGNFNGLFDGVPGTQWWDNQFRFDGNPHPSEIGANEIIDNIEDLGGDYTVIRIPICVARAHAELISRYWVKAYMDMPTYRIPGNHCTSMVAQSWEQTFNAATQWNQSKVGWSAEKVDQFVPNPREINRWITSPTKYAARVLNGSYSGTRDYRHQCGSLKGKKPKAIVINNNPIYDEEEVAKFVKWQVNRSHP